MQIVTVKEIQTAITAVISGTPDVNVTDKAARLLGIVYGNQGQLQQRSSSWELLAQICHAGAQIDPRAIRALTSSDVVSAVKSGTWNIDNLANPHPVTQTTRTNLLVKRERDDLTPKYFTNTFGAAGDYEILAAVADQKHKVYGFDYETSADGSVRLRSGTTTKAIGVSMTKGFVARTLIDPFICNTNEALNFRSGAAMTVEGSILYVTEA